MKNEMRNRSVRPQAEVDSEIFLWIRVLLLRRVSINAEDSNESYSADPGTLPRNDIPKQLRTNR